jgi:uncharacterized protein involved in type VI secretion and phage assembly
MPEITLQSRLTLDPRVRFRRFENDGIIIHQKTAEAIVVSDVATRLLEMTDGNRTLEDCVEAIRSEFDAPAEVIERDVIQFASELAEIGVVAVQA